MKHIFVVNPAAGNGAGLTDILPKIHKALTGFEEDYEIQTAYYMQKWREHTSSIMEPMAEALMKERMQALSDYNERATTYFNYCFDRVPDAEKKMLLEKALETPLPG